MIGVRESDDILAIEHPTSETRFHRPSQQDSLDAACGASTSGPLWRYGAWEAIKWRAIPCDKPECFPQGWATESSEGEAK